MTRRRPIRPPVAMAVVLTGLAGAGLAVPVLPVGAQSLLPGPTHGTTAAGVPRGAAGADGLRFVDAPLETGELYVVIRLTENTLFLVDGRDVLWSAPVGTGTGFRLDGDRESWDFDTPRGVFRVERKEKDPVWIMPDWAFVERGQRIPPPESPLRRQEGALGSTALYIGYELAIHGTDRPELVLDPDPEKRRVSHGCIRMTDEDARRLFHEVDVGTLVLIY